MRRNFSGLLSSGICLSPVKSKGRVHWADVARFEWWAAGTSETRLWRAMWWTT